MIEIRKIKLMEYAQEIEALSKQHWMETEQHVSAYKPEPQRDTYEALEGLGYLVCFAAFDGDQMVGYVTSCVTKHLHYGFLFAAHDLLFVSKPYRDGSTGLKLMRSIEREVKEMGSVFITWTANPDSPFDRILQKIRGVKLEEITYIRRF